MKHTKAKPPVRRDSKTMPAKRQPPVPAVSQMMGQPGGEPLSTGYSQTPPSGAWSG